MKIYRKVPILFSNACILYYNLHNTHGHNYHDFSCPKIGRVNRPLADNYESLEIYLIFAT